jgi:uncharacterized membrane protein YidH (DUF202 family)
LSPFLLWLAIFLIIVGAMSIAVGIAEWWKYRKDE